MIYSNLPRSKVYLKRFCIIILLIIIALSSFFYLTNDFNIFLKILKVLLLWTLIVYLLPLLYLYFTYKKENKFTSLNFFEGNIIVEDLNSSIKFSVKDISYVELNLSFPLFYNRHRLFFWDEYFYSKIVLFNGDYFYITCLLCDELEKFIPKELMLKKRRIFPLISSSSKTELKSNHSSIVEDYTIKKIQVFIEKFKDKPLKELYNITDNPKKFQKPAVEAARKLIKLRNSSVD